MLSRVTVFGGSQPKPGDPIYQDGYRLGKLLAELGLTVLNGGYIGTMEAVSRGAAEAGGKVIGVTCDEIEKWRPVKANPWVTEEWHFRTLQERLLALIENSDACIALPGGVGTLVEISLTWNLLLTHILDPRPLILIGKGWESTLHHFLAQQGEFIPADQRTWFCLAPDVESAIKQLQQIQDDGKL